MTLNWSPLTNRFVAIAILILAILGVFNLLIMPVATMLNSNLDALNDARFRFARLQAIEARLPLPTAPALAPGLVIPAADHGAAGTTLIGIIGAAAARAQLGLVPPQLLPPETGDAKRVSLNVVVTGPEPAVLQFVNDLERGAPLIRFKAWRLSVVYGTPRQLRLEAVAMAAWVSTR